MHRSGNRRSIWRSVPAIVAGILAGTVLVQPAVAHIGRDLAHLIGHLNPVYVNEGQAAGGSLAGSYPNPGIASDVVSQAEIAADGVGSSEIAADGVGSSEIAADGVGSSEIATNAVGASEIGTDAVGASELNLLLNFGARETVSIPGGVEGNGDAHTDGVQVACPLGQEILGVSVNWTSFEADDELYIVWSEKVSSTNWIVIGGNDTDHASTLGVTPLCLVNV